MKVAVAVSAFAALGAALHENKRQAADADLLALSTLVAEASDSLASATVDSMSILEVLATALPQSLLDLALSNSPALSSVVASEFAATKTPDWFGALPGNVQSYLIPPTTTTGNQAATGLASAAPISVSPSRAHPTSAAHTGSYTGLPSISAAVVSSSPFGSLPTTLGISPRPSNATVFSTAALSTGGAAAALPTGVIGAGLAGALGVAGLLAL